MNERMEELEETLQALKGGGGIRDPKIKQDEIDEEFEDLTDKSKDEIEAELEYLGTTYRVLGYFLRVGLVNESNALAKAVEAVYTQIKKFTP